MQKFTYHTHNNNFDIFDGKNTCEEMISKAQELGFETIGVSNHLIWHPYMNNKHAMFYSNLEKAIDIHKKSYDYIKEVGAKYKIKVLVGAETDYFTSLDWEKGFEKIIKEINFDYLIGSNHFLKDENEIN